MKTFSKEWTDEERLKIIVIVAAGIQTDIPAGKYGAVVETGADGFPTKFRPNMQSIIEVVTAPAEMLEKHRADFEEIVREACGGVDADIAKFYAVSLEQMRRESEEWCEEASELVEAKGEPPVH